MSDYCIKHNIRFGNHEDCHICRAEIERTEASLAQNRRRIEKQKTMPGYCSFCGNKLNSKGDCSVCDKEFGTIL